MSKIGIYKITSPTNRVYIGQSIDIDRRFNDYKRLNDIKGQPKIYNSLKKYGWKNHTFEVIEECEIEDLNCRERYWQEYYDVLNGGLNCLLTSTNELPKVVLEETLQKIRNTIKEKGGRRGKNNAMYGRKHRKKTLQILKEKAKGKYKGENNPMYGKESAMKGKKHTNESKKRISEAQLYGKNHRAKLVLNLQNGVFHESASEASETYNINKYTLRAQLNGQNSNKTQLIYC